MDSMAEKGRGGFYFEVIKEGNLIRKLPLSDKERWRIGRQSHACDLTLYHPTVSRKHAVLTLHQEMSQSVGDGPFRAEWHLWLEDLSSKHGTRVNGKTIKGGGRLQLHAGDNVAFARSKRRYWVRQKGSVRPRPK